MAEPKPVRRAEGTAPRQRAGSRRGAARISARAAVSECGPDCCCTRVLSRSIGCRSTAESTPEPRPAAKWKAVCAGGFGRRRRAGCFVVSK